MNQQVVTELVIDAKTGGADAYARAMEQAGAAAEKQSGVLTQVGFAAAGAVAGIIGTQAALRAFVDYVGTINRQFVELYEGARNANLQLREFQELLFAARSSGVTEASFKSGLDRIGQDLAEANRGTTEFGRLFEANRLSIRNANGELKSTREALTDISNLIRNAPTPQVEQSIARIVGLSKDWIPFLRQGTDEIERVKRQAEAAGAIISDDIIKKALEFDKEWKRATAVWDAEMRAAIAGLMPMLKQLADVAIFIVKSLGQITQFFLKSFTPVEDQSVSQLEERIERLNALRGKMIESNGSGWTTRDDLKDAFDAEQALQRLLATKKEIQLANEKSLFLGRKDADLGDLDREIERLKKLIDLKKEAQEEGSPTRFTIYGNGSTTLPPKEEQKDALDREREALDRHIAVLKADAEAVGENVGERARLRAEAQLYAAAERAGIKNTEDYANEFFDLAQKVGDAADALAKARAAADIKFQRDTAFLSPEDVKIAQQLRSIYGNDVPAALASTEAAAIRVNTAIKDSFDGLRDAGKSIFSAFLQGKNVMDAVTQSAERLSSRLADPAFDNLLSGNPISMGIGVVQAGASALLSLFAGDQKRKKQEAADRAEYQRNLASINAYISGAGKDVDNLQRQLAQAEQEMNNFVAAAAKVKDWAKVAEIQAAYVLNVQKIHADELKRQQDEILRRQQSYQDRLFAAANDNETLEGQLAALTRQHERERKEEIRLNGAAINDLVAAQEAERLGLIKRFADEAKDYLLGVAETITDYLNSLKLGDGSILNPQEQFDFAKRQFAEQLGLAQGRDRDALASITEFAETYRSQADKFLGRTEAYADVVRSIEQALLALTRPGGVEGFQRGGLIGNGVYNVDSVLARFANGGAVALAGNEYVTRATSVNAQTLPTLRFINDNGRVPGSDSSRELGMAINRQTEILAASNAALEERVAQMQGEIAELNRKLTMVLANAA